MELSSMKKLNLNYIFYIPGSQTVVLRSAASMGTGQKYKIGVPTPDLWSQHAWMSA